MLSCTTLGLSPSFGFGDRTGLATPGHVAAMQAVPCGIAPIFPQQSIREMSRTQRTPEVVMRDALVGAEQAGWTGEVGADADHLKTTADIDLTAQAGFTFFTFDPSAFVDADADRDDEFTLRKKYANIIDKVRWVDRYLGKRVLLQSGSRIEFTQPTCIRAAVKYGRAIEHAVRLSQFLEETQSLAGRDYEVELSVDETETPTSLAEHYIIADQCLSRGMRMFSLAPRFVGDFEKGVDFKGDLGDIERSFRDHASIAQLLGPYKLSLHSGSDKLSVYRLLAAATGGRFHVKTAGTSYLEAIRVVARHDAALFRELVAFARDRYDNDKATYHVSATLADAPPPEQVLNVSQLEQLYLGDWSQTPAGTGFTEPGRQILHCTFGSVLTHERFGPALRDVLTSHPGTYAEVLKDHFCRHLQALASGL